MTTKVLFGVCEHGIDRDAKLGWCHRCERYERARMINEKYEEGISMREIAARLEIGRSRVHQIISWYRKQKQEK